jgi:hypothetical protein
MSQAEIVVFNVPYFIEELHCPLCGFDVMKALEGVEHSCEHVLFLYIGGEFDYVSPACEGIAREAEEASERSVRWSDDEMKLPEEERRKLPEDMVDPVQYVLERIDPIIRDSVLCFAISAWDAGVDIFVAIEFAADD